MDHNDFYAAFGLGRDDKHINTTDADGVALLAIQALKKENDELRSNQMNLAKENDELEEQNTLLQEQLKMITKRLDQLEQGSKEN